MITVETANGIVHVLTSVIQGLANGVVIGAGLNWWLAKRRRRRELKALIEREFGTAPNRVPIDERWK